MHPVIEVEFDKPRGGYWDGGMKSGGTFSPDIDIFQKGTDIKWGSWGLNMWFITKSGRSWKEAASIAKRKIESKLSVPATVAIRWEE